MGRRDPVDAGKTPEVLVFLQFLEYVGDISGEEDCNEQDLEDRAGVRDWSDTQFGRLLPGPAGGRYRKNLAEDQPFCVFRICILKIHVFRQQ